jgi:hypothetical protein
MTNEELLNALITQVTSTLRASLTDNLQCGFGDAVTVREFGLICKETRKPMDMRITLNVQTKYTG